MKGHEEQLNFTVSRSPWQRMVSVYREKCEGRSKSCFSTGIRIIFVILRKTLYSKYRGRADESQYTSYICHG